MPRHSPSQSTLPILGPSSSSCSSSSRAPFTSKRNRFRALLLVLFAGVVLVLAAAAVFKNNEGENEGVAAMAKENSLLLSPLLPPPASTSTAAAATASTTLSLSTAAASDASKATSAIREHAESISQGLEDVEKAKRGDGGDTSSSLAETTFAAVALADAANNAAASAEDSELVAELRSRIFSQQPPTEDTAPHGGAGRAERVASLREMAVEAEVEFRRRSRRRRRSSSSSSEKTNGLSSLPPPSALARSLFPPQRLAPSHPRYAAICVVLKNQSVDLPEFVAWHAALGVKTFYLFDHGSSPPVSAAQAASMLPPPPPAPATREEETDIHVEPLTEAKIAAHPSRIPQMAAYDSCVASHRAKHEWLAFFDVDEFVVISSSPSSPSPSNSSLPAASSPSSLPASSSSSTATTATTPSAAIPSLPLLLSKYEGAAAALALHWKMFGSGGRVSRKPDSTLTAEAFESCLPRDNGNNRHIKTVASTRMLDIAEPCLGAHHFSYWDFEGAVAEAEAAAEEEEAEKKKSSFPSTSTRRPQPFAVDVEGNRIDGPYSRVPPGESPPKVPHAPAFLAHFVLKSKQEYQAKMLRGNAMKSNKDWSFFEQVDKVSTERCLEASALAKRIKPTMKMTPGV